MVKPSCFVFDLDGTIADNSHRTGFVKSKPKNWAAYNAGMADDKPIIPVIEILDALSTRIIFSTGREERYRTITEEWLYKHLPSGRDYEKLYMRANNDFRDDAVIKKEVLDKIREDYHILGWFDDRPKVVRMLRENGVFVFNVYQGEEDF